MKEYLLYVVVIAFTGLLSCCEKDDNSSSGSASTRPKPLEEVNEKDLGKAIGADGLLYASASDALNAGTGSIAMVCYVGDNADCEHGLGIALKDAEDGRDFYWESASRKLVVGGQIR